MIIDYRREIQVQLEAFLYVVLNARGWGFEPEGRHIALRNIEEIYQKDRGGFWLYYQDDQIIGTVAVRKIDEDKNIGELKCMYVLPEYQGRGYGRLLQDHALEKAKAFGYRYIRLDTTLDSEIALKLYRSAGFYEIERYNDNNIAEVFMELEI